jgi:DNA-binding CsgD family transcriptional regulator
MLVPSELKVVRLLKEGLTNLEIGNLLGISEKAVKFHITNINKKLNTRNRVEIIKVLGDGSEANKVAQLHETNQQLEITVAHLRKQVQQMKALLNSLHLPKGTL